MSLHVVSVGEWIEVEVQEAGQPTEWRAAEVRLQGEVAVGQGYLARWPWGRLRCEVAKGQATVRSPSRRGSKRSGWDRRSS